MRGEGSGSGDRVELPVLQGEPATPEQAPD